MATAADEIGEQVESLLAQLARQGGKRAAATAESTPPDIAASTRTPQD